MNACVDIYKDIIYVAIRRKSKVSHRPKNILFPGTSKK